jgi:hypothetical protein
MTQPDGRDVERARALWERLIYPRVLTIPEAVRDIAAALLAERAAVEEEIADDLESIEGYGSRNRLEYAQRIRSGAYRPPTTEEGK